jgi:hypothetical protein
MEEGPAKQAGGAGDRPVHTAAARARARQALTGARHDQRHSGHGAKAAARAWAGGRVERKKGTEHSRAWVYVPSGSLSGAPAGPREGAAGRARGRGACCKAPGAIVPLRECTQAAGPRPPRPMCEPAPIRLMQLRLPPPGCCSGQQGGGATGDRGAGLAPGDRGRACRWPAPTPRTVAPLAHDAFCGSAPQPALPAICRPHHRAPHATAAPAAAGSARARMAAPPRPHLSRGGIKRRARKKAWRRAFSLRMRYRLRSQGVRSHAGAATCGMRAALFPGRHSKAHTFTGRQRGPLGSRPAR